MKIERGPTQEDRERAKVFDRVPGAYNKRGKVLPQTQAAWGARGGDGQEHDPTRGQSVLDEALK